MGNKQQAARAALHLSTGLGIVAGLVLLALAIWTLKDKTFLDELLRSRLYMDATYIILVVSAVLTLLSCFGCFAARKEIKCFVLAYFVVLLLFTVVLVIGGVLAYVFREQVEWTMRAEMLTELRRYNPATPTERSTQAWRLTQRELQCCGFMTNKVDMPWQMWRYNKALNISPPPSPASTVLPASCCNRTTLQLGEACTGSSTSLHSGDCLSLAVQYTRQHAATLGAAAVAISCLMVPGLVSSLILFKSII